MLRRFSCVRLVVTPWTIACQTALSMGFSRQEYWRRFPFPSPGDLPNPGIKPVSLVSPAWADRFFITVLPGKPHCLCVCIHAKSLHSCLTLHNPTECSPPGSSVHGILQARILEGVTTRFSRGSFCPKDRSRVSCGSCIAGRFFITEPPGKPLKAKSSC